MKKILKNYMPQNISFDSMDSGTKFKLLSKYKSKALEKRLRKLLKNLYIQIGSETKHNIFKLYDRKKLEGWCWQTTQSIAPFLQDEELIERGVLNIDKNNRNYFHSWLLIKYDNLDFVFDPCLCCLNLKELYYNIFQIDKRGEITVKAVKSDLFDRIKRSEKLSEEIKVSGKEDVNAPFFRGVVGYKEPLIRGDSLQSVTAHYYLRK